MIYRYDHLKRSHAQEAFTFIEIVVAVLIMGILAAVVGTGALQYLKRANRNSTITSLNALSQAIDLYKADMGTYPKQLEDLIEAPKGAPAKKWQGPYLSKSKTPQDGWGNEFYYKAPGKNHPYDLSSYGPNGEAAPEEEHISVWEI